MPYTINGIGTWYWGKRNLQPRMGTCEFCQHFGELKSYDTTLYFVVFYLPIIPLGRKRIIDECPSCRRHRVTSLHEYHAARQKALAESLQGMKAAPNDPAKTRAALEVMLAYQDRKNFDLMAATMSSRFQNDEDIQALLAEGHMFFSNHEAAEKAWRRAIQIHDTPHHRERLAACLIVLGRPGDAAPWIGHLLAAGSRDRIGLLYLLVEGYQAVGMHAEAIALMDQIEAVWPDMAQDKGHRKYRSISAKRIKSGKPVKSALLQKPRSTGGSGIDWSGRMAKLFLPAAVAVAGIVYLVVCASMGRSREVFLVNGTATQYTVNVNGQERMLRPAKPVSIVLPEGDWDVSVSGDSRGIEPARIPVHTPFFARPFVRRTLVINPDRVAILITETATYAVGSVPRTDNAYQVHTGRAFYEFKGMDYVFEPFPETIRLPKNTGYVKKDRVFVYVDKPLSLVGFLSSELGKEACIDYVARRAGYEPEESVWLHAFTGMAQSETVLKVVRTRLETRPLLIEWHRMYQSLTEVSKPDHDLAGEYRKLLDKDPGNSYLKYLLGRVTKSRAESDKLYQAAEEGAKPIGYGYHAMAYYQLCQGAYPEAATLAAKAVAAAPDVLQFESTHSLAQQAAGQYEDLLKAARADCKREPKSFAPVYREFLWLVALNRKDEAKALAAQYRAGTDSELGVKVKASIQAMFDSVLAYQEGRFDDYAKIGEQQGTPAWGFCAALSRGKAAEAAACLAKMEAPDFVDHLLLYMCACEAGDPALADKEWSTGLGAMLKSIDVETDIKNLFRDGKIPPADALAQAVMLPGQKRILLAACGLKDPAGRDALFAKARQLNFDLVFPHAFIDRITKPKEDGK